METVQESIDWATRLGTSLISVEKLSHSLEVTIHASWSNNRDRLFTLEISRFRGRDVTDLIVESFLESFSKLFQEARDKVKFSQTDPSNRILCLIQTPVELAMDRHFRNNEYSIRLKKIHTAEPAVWFS